MDRKQQAEKQHLRLWPLTALLALWVAICMLRWEIVQLLTPFLMLPFLGVCFVATAVVFVIYIIRAIRCFKTDGSPRRLWSGLVIAILFAATVFLPLDDFYENVRFSALAYGFDNAAREIIEADTDAGIHLLPSRYAGLSRSGGEVIVSGEGDRKIVLFFSFRGILDNFSVYACAPNEKAYDHLLQYEAWMQTIPLRGNWYFCTSS